MPQVITDDDYQEQLERYENDPNVSVAIHLYLRTDCTGHIIVHPETLSPSQVIAILEDAIKNVKSVQQ